MNNAIVERHAYLIMAHHRFDVLKEILCDLDDERNDIFLHIDKKARGIAKEELQERVRNANLIFTESMNVHWGGFSQIACVTMLLEQATRYDRHAYYHFMVGVEFPLKDQKYIHDFFNTNAGKEFIGFDNFDLCFYERVQYYHPFNEYARNNTVFQKLLNKIRIISIEFQKMLHVDLRNQYPLKFKKGNANWSITHELASYIVAHKKEIYKIYRHSFCGDEVFIHTLVYNSIFWKRVYCLEDEYMSSMRITPWNNPHNQYHLGDVPRLIESGRLFARKIDGEDALQVIKKIKEMRA